MLLASLLLFAHTAARTHKHTYKHTPIPTHTHIKIEIVKKKHTQIPRHVALTETHGQVRNGLEQSEMYQILVLKVYIGSAREGESSEREGEREGGKRVRVCVW